MKKSIKSFENKAIKNAGCLKGGNENNGRDIYGKGMLGSGVPMVPVDPVVMSDDGF